MPMVGGKKYPYTAKGIAAAKKAAKKDDNKPSNTMAKVNMMGYKYSDVNTGQTKTRLPGDTAEKKRMMALKNKLSTMKKSKGK